MITLYGVSGSPYVRKVQIVLAEKHLAYEMETVIPMVQPGGAVTTVWPGGGSVGYETIHPLKKVPALRDERGTLADSSVICAYLDRAYPDPQLYPSDPYLYGRALWFEEYGDTGLVAVIGLQIFRERVIAPSMMGRPTDDALVQKALDEGVPPLFNYLESQVKDGEFLCGSFSIADIGICTQLLSYRYSGYEPDPKRWPKFAAYAERVFARPSFQERLREEAGFARAN